MNRNDIIAALPKLSSADLVEVTKAIKAQAQFGSTKPSQPDLIPSDWVLSGIVTLLIRENVLAAKGAYFDIKRRNAYKDAYLSKLPGLMCFLTDLKNKSKMGKRHEPQLSFLCAKALETHLKAMGIFGVSTMLSQIDRIPQALDDAYPGYVSAGLFGFIVAKVDQ